MKTAIKIFGLILMAVLIYFALPPRIVKVEQFEKYQETKGKIVKEIKITFDKPVSRKDVELKISPYAPLEWRFEDPVVNNHFFTSVVFTPLKSIKEGSFVEIKNARNIFTGTASNAIENIEPVEEPEITFIDIPIDWQDSALSCEAASLKMALYSKNVFVEENEIMEKIGYSEPKEKGKTWGDPYKAFVGDIKGKMCKSGFGVFWNPVEKAANNWRKAEAFSNWDLKSLTEELSKGNPVIIWGTLPKSNLTNCSWKTDENKDINVYKETHVKLAVGYIGKKANPESIIFNDPLAGKFYWSSSYFLENWKRYNYSGVVIR